MEPKPKRGKTPGSGRKKHVPPLKRRNFYLTDDQLKLLRAWGRGDACAGLRWLIDTAATVIRRPAPNEEGR